MLRLVYCLSWWHKTDTSSPFFFPMISSCPALLAVPLSLCCTQSRILPHCSTVLRCSYYSMCLVATDHLFHVGLPVEYSDIEKKPGGVEIPGHPIQIQGPARACVLVWVCRGNTCFSQQNHDEKLQEARPL